MRTQIATIPVPRLSAPRQRIEPTRVNPSACKPSGETHLSILSGVPVSNNRNHDRERFANVRTAFQGSRNVFRG
jgi:hypothetical protein